ncbi:CLUMA_CG014084, isoform A [Clunio marinus]|uniref:CLUMA_CG014084, isoform A n=1 Tax=Clunio marinus TaxID=568069 RepID=A0A1J1IQS2_9DIPT|nr:CLUMA_CG014084, isoform A [Clunio marinus]
MLLIYKKIKDSKPAYQFLESRPGYIPVYIRLGDQPLSEIHPLLAEAFGERMFLAQSILKTFLNIINKITSFNSQELDEKEITPLGSSSSDSDEAGLFLNEIIPADETQLGNKKKKNS